MCVSKSYYDVHKFSLQTKPPIAQYDKTTLISLLHINSSPLIGLLTLFLHVVRSKEERLVDFLGFWKFHNKFWLFCCSQNNIIAFWRYCNIVLIGECIQVLRLYWLLLFAISIGILRFLGLR